MPKKKSVKQKGKSAQIGKTKRSRKELWLLLLALIITFVCFTPALNSEFINLDDQTHITHNPIVLESDVEGAFTRLFGSPHYKPLVYLSWIIENQLFGLDSMILHLNNLLLHLLNCFLIFYICLSLFSRFRIDSIQPVHFAFFVTILFGIHPLHVESVAWAIERKDVLFCAFYFGSWLAFLRRLEGGGAGLLALSLLLFIAAILSKAMSITLPFVLLLSIMLYHDKLDKKALMSLVPFMLLLVGGMAIYGMFTRFDKFGAGVTGGIFDDKGVATDPENIDDMPGWYKRILVISFRFIAFLAHILAPVRLAIIYPREFMIGAMGSGIHLFPVALIASSVAVLYLMKRLPKWLTFSLAFFTFTISPALLMNDRGPNFLADRYTYVPSIGIFIILIVLTAKLLSRLPSNLSILKKVIPTVVILVLAFACYSRCLDWKDSQTLWKDAIDKYPNDKLASAEARLFYGLTVFQDAQYLPQGEEREEQYAWAAKNARIAVRMKPYYGTAWDCLGLIYESWEKWDSSLHFYNKAFTLDSAKFDNREKIEALQLKSIGLDDEMFNTYFSQALESIKSEDFNIALSHLKKAKQLKPFHEDILYCFGLCYERLGNFDAAIEHYQQCLEVNSDYEKALNNMGIIYFKHSQFNEAEELFKRLTTINPENLKALNNLGLIYMNLENYERAEHFFRKALAIDPTYETATRNLLKIELLKQGIDLSGGT